MKLTHFQVLVEQRHSAGILQMKVLLPRHVLVRFVFGHGAVLALPPPIIHLAAVKQTINPPARATFNWIIIEDINKTLQFLFVYCTYGKRYSMQLFQNCLPTIIIASWMQSSLRHPAGSQMSPFKRKNSLFLTISSLKSAKI